MNNYLIKIRENKFINILENITCFRFRNKSCDCLLYFIIVHLKTKGI